MFFLLGAQDLALDIELYSVVNAMSVMIDLSNFLINYAYVSIYQNKYSLFNFNKKIKRNKIINKEDGNCDLQIIFSNPCLIALNVRNLAQIGVLSH